VVDTGSDAPTTASGKIDIAPPGSMGDPNEGPLLDAHFGRKAGAFIGGVVSSTLLRVEKGIGHSSDIAYTGSIDDLNASQRRDKSGSDHQFADVDAELTDNRRTVTGRATIGDASSIASTEIALPPAVHRPPTQLATAQ